MVDRSSAQASVCGRRPIALKPLGLRMACGWGWRPVPSFQVRLAAGPALSTGLMWSLGNFFSIYATEFLGMAIAFPLVQCNLVVSSLWGILYYREVQGASAVAAFFASTGVVLLGVLLLGLAKW
jgi:Transmembrane family, TMEM144 of transporters